MSTKVTSRGSGEAPSGSWTRFSASGGARAAAGHHKPPTIAPLWCPRRIFLRRTSTSRQALPQVENLSAHRG